MDYRFGLTNGAPYGSEFPALLPPAVCWVRALTWWWIA